MTVTTDSAAPGHKAILDSLLLPIPGVEGGEMSGSAACFVIFLASIEFVKAGRKR
jgi:hypothetical protein